MVKPPHFSSSPIPERLSSQTHAEFANHRRHHLTCTPTAGCLNLLLTPIEQYEKTLNYFTANETAAELLLANEKNNISYANHHAALLFSDTSCLSVCPTAYLTALPP